MRKFLTLFAALFASLSIWAGVTVFTEASQVTTDGSYTIYGSNSSASNQANVIFPDPAAETGFPAGTQSEGTYYSKISGTSDLGAKLAENKRVAVKGLAKGDQITVYWFATNTTNTTLTLSYATASNKGAKLYDGETQNPVVSKTIYVSQLPALTDDDIDKIVNGYAESEGLAYISSNNAIYVYAVKIAASCEAPAEALVFDADKKVDIIVGDEITFSTTGGNGGDVTIAGKDGETITENKWTATKGEHTFIATQEVKDGVCGNSVELKLTVVSNDPVTAATISGKTSAVIGEEVELTCVAAEATSFQWYKDNAKIDGATEATYTFTADAKGSFVFFCEASNKNNTEPVKSNELTINVTEVCGMLIKATHKSGKSADIDPASVIGGTADKNTQDDGKLGKNGHYFGVKLAAGQFLEGDEVIIVADTLYGGNTATIYSDKGSNLLGSADFDAGSRTATFELPSDAEAVYVYRTSPACNPGIASITVNRPCDDDEAKLNVSPASIELAATAKNNGKAEAKVKFTGRHLAAGTYNLALTEVEGLSVNPKSVTVDADGKLAAEVTVAFESAVDVLGANGELSLTVGELTKKVDIAYSANLKKTYAKAIDIEQLILDNGVNFDIQSELTKRGYDFASLSGLDSLNSAKDNNNEPYLGLKIKTAGGFIGCWLKADATVEVKFGHVDADVKFIANGAELTKTPAELADPFTYKAEGGDAYIELRTTTGGTVVVKHITFEGGAPLSNDVTLNWLKIEDKAVTADENKVYAYQVPVDFTETDLTVTFELHDANAMADKKSPFLASVPEFGATAPIDTKLTVTAEDGETKAEYIIRVSRVAPSTEASIKELKIDGKVIAENDGKFEYEVAFDSKQTEVEVAFVLADKATADRDNPFKVAVPDNPDMGATQAVIKVTAEDKVTTKEYKVIVTRAEEPQQGIDSVQASEINSQKVIRNGQLFILKNGVLYNAQGAVMR